MTVGLGRVPFSILGWVILFALTFLEPNRSGRAWHVFVLAILLQGTLSILSFAMGGELSAPISAYTGLVFALGTLWLLMPYLSSKGWPTTFWGAFITILIGTCVFGFSGLDQTGFLIFLLYVGFNSGLAFALALRSCRKNPHIGAFIVWLLLWTCVLWVVTTIPWIIVAVAEAGLIALTAVFVVLIGASVAICITFAFVTLSAIKPFYRTRFYAFLGLTPAANTPPIPPVIPAPAT